MKTSPFTLFWFTCDSQAPTSSPCLHTLSSISLPFPQMRKSTHDGSSEATTWDVHGLEVIPGRLHTADGREQLPMHSPMPASHCACCWPLTQCTTMCASTLHARAPARGQTGKLLSATPGGDSYLELDSLTPNATLKKGLTTSPKRPPLHVSLDFKTNGVIH